MKMYIVEEPTLKQQQKYYLHAKGQNRTLTSKTILRKRKKNQRSSYLKDFQKFGYATLNARANYFRQVHKRPREIIVIKKT